MQRGLFALTMAHLWLKAYYAEKRLSVPGIMPVLMRSQDSSVEPPGLDSLATFATRVEGEDVLVKLPAEISPQRTLEMASHAPQQDSRTIAVIGAGAAGMNAVETLRQQGFQGQVILISDSTKLPYDRTKLSKGSLQGKADLDSLSLRSCEFYDRHDIELRFGSAVTKVDAPQ